MRLLRVRGFGLVWSSARRPRWPCSVCLWIVSGFGGRLDTEPYQSRHYADHAVVP